MIAIDTLGERGEDGSICAGDCLSADALDNHPFLTDLLNERSR
jgi:chromosome condensin MukBEF MukE localization factor